MTPTSGAPTGAVVLVAAMATALVALMVGCAAPTASGPSAPGSAPTATAPTAPVAAPTAVTIPAIGAASTLIPTGLDAAGELEVPNVDTPEQASWWTGSPEPGALGPAVLLGHVDGDGGRPGVFNRLDELGSGDEILVDRADGTRARFVIDRVLQVPKPVFDDPDAPVVAEVYGDTAGPELRLITCGGSFDRAADSYRDQVVAFAHLESP